MDFEDLDIDAPEVDKYRCCCNMMSVKTGAKILAVISFIAHALSIIFTILDGDIITSLFNIFGMTASVCLILAVHKKYRRFALPFKYYLIFEIAAGMVAIVLLGVLFYYRAELPEKSKANIEAEYGEIKNWELFILFSIFWTFLGLIFDLWSYYILWKCRQCIAENKRRVTVDRYFLMENAV